MQYSVVSTKNLNDEFRIDSEYYKPDNLTSENVVKRHKYELLGNICKLISGPFGSAVTKDKYDTNSNSRYIRGKDIQSFFVEQNDPVFIKKSLFEKLSQFHLKDRDILITVVGMNFGKVAIIFPEDFPALFSCKSTLLRNTSINTFFLAAYLSSKIGYRLVRRGQRGVAQPGINLFDIQNIPVPILSDTFQNSIEGLLIKARSWLQKSTSLYTEAEKTLLSELGLLNWKPKHHLSFVKNYTDTKQAGRFDAEYFQPKYDEIVEIIQSYAGDWDTLGKLASTQRGSMISDKFYNYEKGIAYIRGADFSGGSLSKEKMVLIDRNFKLRNEIRAKKGEIVFSLIGSVGETALVTDEFSGSYISNNTGKITLTDKRLNPVILQIILRSVIGKMYFDKYKMQTAQPKISDKDLHNFVVPLLNIDIQQNIQQKVNESFRLRKQSRHLLDCAKKAVEIAIEKDEQKAMNYKEERMKML